MNYQINLFPLGQTVSQTKSVIDNLRKKTNSWLLKRKKVIICWSFSINGDVGEIILNMLKSGLCLLSRHAREMHYLWAS